MGRDVSWVRIPRPPPGEDPHERRAPAPPANRHRPRHRPPRSAAAAPGGPHAPRRHGDGRRGAPRQRLLRHHHRRLGPEQVGPGQHRGHQRRHRADHGGRRRARRRLQRAARRIRHPPGPGRRLRQDRRRAQRRQHGAARLGRPLARPPSSASRATWSCPSPRASAPTARARHPPCPPQPLNTALSDGGLPCVAKTVAQFTGLDIPYAALIEFNGVIEMSNAVGGVPVCLASPLKDKRTDLDLPAGVTPLQGKQALQFLRTRHAVGDGSDLARISNQQVFLSALVRTMKQSSTLSDPTRVYGLAKAAVDNMQRSTSLDYQTMASMALALKDIPLDQVRFLQYPGTTNGTGVYAGKVQPLKTDGDQLMQLLKADAPFEVKAGNTGLGAVAEKPAGSTPLPRPPPARRPARRADPLRPRRRRPCSRRPSRAPTRARSRARRRSRGELFPLPDPGRTPFEGIPLDLPLLMASRRAGRERGRVIRRALGATRGQVLRLVMASSVLVRGGMGPGGLRAHRRGEFVDPRMAGGEGRARDSAPRMSGRSRPPQEGDGSSPHTLCSGDPSISFSFRPESSAGRESRSRPRGLATSSRA
ncbi:LCP family protein [Clavibacter zhangzhiyongii]|uniref:LCP family protein n=1 Tax=Clavibacter zhangzhiyongii TaxID=2768071 RepID=UPI0039E0CB11